MMSVATLVPPPPANPPPVASLLPRGLERVGSGQYSTRMSPDSPVHLLRLHARWLPVLLGPTANARLLMEREELTARVERLTENFELFDFVLTRAEMAEIGRLAQPKGRVVNAAGRPPHLWRTSKGLGGPAEVPNPP